MTISPFMALLLFYLFIGAFFAGAERIRGELRWIEIVTGRQRDDDHMPRRYYFWTLPLETGLLWGLKLPIADFRLWKARREKEQGGK